MGYTLSFSDGPNLRCLRAIGHKFWYPKIERKFSHPAVNAENLRANGRISDRAIVARVVGGLKPVGFLDTEDRRVTRPVEEAGGRVYAASYGLLSVTMGGRIGELFDLAALAADYRAWLVEEKAATTLRLVLRELRKLAPMDLRDFLDFRDVGCNVTPRGLARSGLVLGYPVESTVALLRRDLGLSGGVV